MTIGSEYTFKGRTYTVSGYVTVGGALLALWLTDGKNEFKVTRKELT